MGPHLPSMTPCYSPSVAEGCAPATQGTVSPRAHDSVDSCLWWRAIRMSILFRSEANAAGSYRYVALVIVTLAGIVPGSLGQAATSQGAGSQHPASQANAEKTKPTTSGAKPAEAPPVLVQLNGALETLAAKVSPAVVQILVTGYGPLREEDRSQTAFIVRQHAVGSGGIVDANGYIMTNAHVVEGAQRIRVALPIPTGDSGGQAPIGKRRILEARLLGQHKETDLALLKIDDTDLPNLPLLST